MSFFAPVTVSIVVFCCIGRPQANGFFHSQAGGSVRPGAEESSRFRHAVASKQQFSDDDPLDNRLTLETLAHKLANGDYRNVIVVMGAGASTSAGVPDFRSPKIGLYDSIAKEYNLPMPESVFELAYFRKNPVPFVQLCQSLWPKQAIRPTRAHVFLRLLQDKGVLQRVYTQNIDGLEATAKVDTENVLVECHGHFRSASCIECRQDADIHACMESILQQKQVPKCTKCGGYIKPDVVFFGEELPQRFQSVVHQDVQECDLLIIIGTSLLVMPVAGIPSWVKPSCPRLLLNRELVGDILFHQRDVFEKGDCDDGVLRLCQYAGWEEELLRLHEMTVSER